MKKKSNKHQYPYPKYDKYGIFEDEETINKRKKIEEFLPILSLVISIMLTIASIIFAILYNH